jgi:hypothetical protein
MFKLYVGGRLVQFGEKLSDLSLLKDPDIRKQCPYHRWELCTEDITIDISQYDPSEKLIVKTLEYFDGTANNVFMVNSGLGGSKFKVEY